MYVAGVSIPRLCIRRDLRRYRQQQLITTHTNEQGGLFFLFLFFFLFVLFSSACFFLLLFVLVLFSFSFYAFSCVFSSPCSQVMWSTTIAFSRRISEVDLFISARRVAAILSLNYARATVRERALPAHPIVRERKVARIIPTVTLLSDRYAPMCMKNTI